MGVAGAGKTTVGRLVAQRLGAPFVDADDFHSPPPIAAMGAGRPPAAPARRGGRGGGRRLDDAERPPWLARVRAAARAAVPDGTDGPVVLACSALKHSYRDLLRDGVPELTFVDLDVDPATLADRLESRI